MTKTELDLYIELQDVFAPFRGEWQRWDRIYYKFLQKEGIIFFVCPTIVELYLNKNLAPIFVSKENTDIAWLPLPIDPVNPKRGLWEMVAGVRKLERHGGKFPCWYEDDWNGEVQSSGPTPTEALLRAIKAQKEGK